MWMLSGVDLAVLLCVSVCECSNDCVLCVCHVGLSDSGVRAGIQRVWVQSSRRDRVQHGSVHSEAG